MPDDRCGSWRNSRIWARTLGSATESLPPFAEIWSARGPRPYAAPWRLIMSSQVDSRNCAGPTAELVRFLASALKVLSWETCDSTLEKLEPVSAADERAAST